MGQITFYKNPGRFGPIPVRSGRFGPISGVSCFGPISKVGCFGLIYLFEENRKDIRLSSP